MNQLSKILRLNYNLYRIFCLNVIVLFAVISCTTTPISTDPISTDPIKPIPVIPELEAPVIVNTAFTVDEVAEATSILGKVIATDPTNQNLSYKILSGNIDDTFALDGDSGELSLQLRLNHDVTPEFNLEIQVEDTDGFLDKETIGVTVNRDETIYNWRLLSSWVSTYAIYDLINDTLNNNLVDELKTRSGGQLNITVYPVDLVKDVGYLDVYDQVKDGEFELGHTASYWYTTQNAANAFFTSQPFGLSEEQFKTWLKAEGQDLWNDINAQDNLIAFRAGTSGEKSIGWFNSPVTVPSDLNGLRWRIAGFGSEVARRAGANVIPTAALPQFTEYATILKDGTVDALRWSDPYSDWQLDLHTSNAIYYRGPDWSEQSAALAMYISLDTYNALPIRLQSAIKEASEATAVAMSDAYKLKNAQALVDLQAYGVDIRDFPQAVLDVLETHANAIQAEKVVASEDYRKVYESWKKFR